MIRPATRLLVGLLLVSAFGLLSCNEDKIVGKWNHYPLPFSEPGERSGLVYEFTSDGKVRIEPLGWEFDYELSGNTLTIKTGFGDSESKVKFEGKNKVYFRGPFDMVEPEFDDTSTVIVDGIEFSSTTNDGFVGEWDGSWGETLIVRANGTFSLNDFGYMVDGFWQQRGSEFELEGVELLRRR